MQKLQGVLVISMIALVVLMAISVYSQNTQYDNLERKLERMDSMMELCEKMMQGGMGQMMGGMRENSSMMGSMEKPAGMSEEEHASHHPDAVKV